jgi:hypothetical protein
MLIYTGDETGLVKSYSVEKDKIFSRFVFQHIPNREAQLKAAKSLYHSLAPGGSLYLIDCYGFLSHLDTNNSWLKEQIKRVEECIPIDMNINEQMEDKDNILISILNVCFFTLQDLKKFNNLVDNGDYHR